MNNSVSLGAQTGMSYVRLQSSEYPEEEHTAFWKKHNALKGKALAEFRENAPPGKDFSLDLAVGPKFGVGITAKRKSYREVDLGTSRGRFDLYLKPDGDSFLAFAAPKDNDRMILGAATLTNAKTGVEERRPNSSLVFLDTKGTGFAELTLEKTTQVRAIRFLYQSILQPGVRRVGFSGTSAKHGACAII